MVVPDQPPAEVPLRLRMKFVSAVPTTGLTILVATLPVPPTAPVMVAPETPLKPIRLLAAPNVRALLLASRM